MDSLQLPILLQDEKGLVGKDLDRVIRAFKVNKKPDKDSMTNLAKFKKKEPLETMPKSIIKHRVQTLTGRGAAELEAELGFSVKAGKTMGVEEARWWAHLLILESNGVLKVEDEAPKTPKRKRDQVSDNEDAMEVDDGAQIGLESASKRARSGRRSLMTPQPKTEVAMTPRRASRRSVAPETLARATTNLKDQEMQLGCKLVPTRSGRGKKQVPQVVHEEEEEEETSANDDDAGVEEDGNLGLDNPTPQMLAQKRKSMGVSTTGRTKRGITPKKPLSTTTSTSTAVTTTSRTNGSSLTFDNGFTGVKLEGEAVKRCKVYLVNGDPSAAVEPGVLKGLVPSFTGANLTLVHTPADWQPPEIFNAVKAVRGINKEAGLDSFLVLVGCGLANVHMFREALLRQTVHVQFLTVEVEEQNAGVNDGKLRETTSFFLLAYFFPGCNVEGSSLPERMVRENTSTCLRAETVEALENLMLHTFSEGGDWILDLCCRSRELSLAAMLTGRFAIAVEEDLTRLECLRKGAAIIEKKEVGGKNSKGSVIKLT